MLTKDASVVDKPTIVFLLWKNLHQISGVTSWVLTLRPFLEAAGYSLKIAVEKPDFSDCGDEGVDLKADNAEALVQGLLEWSPAVLVIMNTEAQRNFAYAVSEANRRGGSIHLLSVLHSDSEEEYYEPLEFFDRHTHTFLAVSQKIRSEVEKSLPWRTGRVEALPYGVNCPDVVERIAHTLPLRIAYAGRVIQKQKRSLDIIPLVQELEKRNLDFRLSIIGDGPELDSLKKSLSIAAQNGKVLFVGRMSQDQMEEAWKDQDIFLNVSAFEGTSVSMLEAMAAGCAPIVTHVSGVDDVIEQGVNGFHAPVGDFQSLAGFVERLDRDRQLLAHVGNAAHRTIEERFSICDYAQKFAALTNCLMHQDLTRIPGHHYIKPETLPNGDVSVRGTGPLTVYTLFADECRDMMNEWFFGTMRDDWSVYGYCASGLDSDETNRHGSIAQSAPINRKVDLIIKSLSDCWGRVILWINPEVQFFGRCSKMIDEALLNHDIAFQSEGSSIPGHSPRMACCGIMAMRCNKAVLGFWTKVREMLAASPEAFPDGDQSAVNHLLAEQTVPIRAVLFDSRFWASSHGIMPPLEILAHHVHPAAPLLSRSPLDFTLQQFSGVRDYLNTLQLTPLTIAFEPLVLRARRKGIKKLACWPAGSGGREFLKLARQAGIEVTAFIDSNPTLQDTFIDDIRVLSPVQTLHAGSDTFAITSLIHSAPISRAIKKLFSGSGRVPRIFASMKSDRAFENQIRLINRKPKGIDGPCPEAYRRAKKCV